MYQGFVHSYIPSAESRKIQHACRTFSSISPYNLQLRPTKKEVFTKTSQKNPSKTHEKPTKTHQQLTKTRHFWVKISMPKLPTSVATTLNPTPPAVLGGCVDSVPGRNCGEPGFCLVISGTILDELIHKSMEIID
jgi:hypothetical protein